MLAFSAREPGIRPGRIVKTSASQERPRGADPLAARLASRAEKSA